MYSYPPMIHAPLIFIVDRRRICTIHIIHHISYMTYVIYLILTMSAINVSEFIGPIRKSIFHNNLLKDRNSQ